MSCVLVGNLLPSDLRHRVLQYLDIEEVLALKSVSTESHERVDAMLVTHAWEVVRRWRGSHDHLLLRNLCGAGVNIRSVSFMVDGAVEETLQKAVACGFADVVTCLLTRYRRISSQDAAGGESGSGSRAHDVDDESGGIDLLVRDRGDRTLLHFAASSGSVATVEALLSLRRSDVDINAMDMWGVTPLHIAACGGEIRVGVVEPWVWGQSNGMEMNARNHVDVVKALLADTWIDVDVFDNRGNTPLHYAAGGVFNETLSALLGFDGIDTNVHARNNAGNTPLHEAVEHGRVDNIATLLRRSGTDVNPSNHKGNTPLHLAANRSHYLYDAVVRALLSCDDVDVNATNNSGYTPLHIVAEEGRYDVFCALLAVDGIDVNRADNCGNTPLHAAARKHSVKIIDALLELSDSVNVNATNNDGQTALHIAAEHGRYGIFRTLLATGGIDVHTADNRGNTPLHAAAYKHNVKIIDALLESADSVDLNATNGDGQTVLHIAAGAEHFRYDHDVFLTLLEIDGLDVNTADNHGYNPLHEAARVHNVKIINELLGSANSIDANPVNNSNGTPLHMAARKKPSSYVDPDVFSALLAYDDGSIDVNMPDLDGNTVLHLATGAAIAEYEYEDRAGAFSEHEGIHKDRVIDALLTLDGVDANAVNDDGDAALHLAARCARGAKIVAALLSADDVDVNMWNSDGDTPLHVAVAEWRGDVDMEVIKTLLTATGVDVNAANSDGDTALHVAARYDHRRIVHELRWCNGIDTNAANRDGDTPLHTAARYGRIEIIKELLAHTGREANDTDNDDNMVNNYDDIDDNTVTDNEGADANTVTDNGNVDDNAVNNRGGTDVNAVNKNGDTPLHVATNMNLAATIAILLKHDNIDTSIANKDGATPLDVARRSDRLDAIEALWVWQQKNQEVNSVRASAKLNLG